jgi:hypothetical protein
MFAVDFHMCNTCIVVFCTYAMACKHAHIADTWTANLLHLNCKKYTYEEQISDIMRHVQQTFNIMMHVVGKSVILTIGKWMSAIPTCVKQTSDHAMDTKHAAMVP